MTISLTWPAFGALRAASHANKPSRFRLALSALVSEAQLVFGACFLLARNAPPWLPARRCRAPTSIRGSEHSLSTAPRFYPRHGTGAPSSATYFSPTCSASPHPARPHGCRWTQPTISVLPSTGPPVPRLPSLNVCLPARTPSWFALGPYPRSPCAPSNGQVFCRRQHFLHPCCGLARLPPRLVRPFM